eukprot:gnl/MRDRNA2_/MRDRNA2_42671_c0_seq2.p1 gnl/MRDRNA2_/MRDRNA2_42671_c0~~gnl/MRDRNA2_/MRDRNA2_42671_c0_seq2.p1  ORF type:complete len:1043 (-),score=216.35 gnl/MRDRNA2_/MRDRNA2_42671_c0_seq2:113-3097(-)
MQALTFTDSEGGSFNISRSFTAQKQVTQAQADASSQGCESEQRGAAPTNAFAQRKPTIANHRSEYGCVHPGSSSSSQDSLAALVSFFEEELKLEARSAEKVSSKVASDIESKLMATVDSPITSLCASCEAEEHELVPFTCANLGTSNPDHFSVDKEQEFIETGLEAGFLTKGSAMHDELELCNAGPDLLAHASDSASMANEHLTEQATEFISEHHTQQAAESIISINPEDQNCAVTEAEQAAETSDINLAEDTRVQAAVLKIQSRQRGKLARASTDLRRQRRKSEQLQEQAAVRIQSNYRGKAARQHASAKRTSRVTKALGLVSAENRPHKPESEVYVVFSPQERSLLKSYFELHDVDRSGNISISELLLVVDDMDRTPQPGSEDEKKLLQLFEECDRDESGELDFSEFLHLIESYYLSVYTRVFNTQDKDRSGSISIDELAGALEELENAGFRANASDAKRLYNTIDKDGDGVLEFDEFCDLMEEYRLLEFKHLQLSAGFTATLQESFQLMFNAADEDNSGALEIKEVVKLFEKTNLGMSLSDPEVLEEFVEVIARMDKDLSATLDFAEFLRLLKVWDKMGTRANQHATVKSGSQESMSRVPKVLSKALDNDLLRNDQQRWARRASIDVVANKIEDLVLVKHRELSLQEIQALREDFMFSDSDGSGTIDESELLSLLKNCGCEPSTEIQKASLTACLAKLKFSGAELDLNAVVRLVKEYHNECCTAAVKDYHDAGEKGHGVVIPLDQLNVTFYRVGQYMSRAQINDLKRSVGIDQNSTAGIPENLFRQMVEIRRIQQLNQWRSTYGFSKVRLKEFKSCFDSNCPPEIDRIPSDKVFLLVRKLGYDIHSEEGDSHNVILERFMFSLQGEDNVAWPQFLLLIKQLDTEQVAKKKKEEKQLAEAIGLHEDALNELRKFFQDCDIHGTGKIAKKCLKSLLSSMGVAKSQEERKALRQSCDEISGEWLDFMQFLQILQTVDARCHQHRRSTLHHSATM